MAETYRGFTIRRRVPATLAAATPPPGGESRNKSQYVYHDDCADLGDDWYGYGSSVAACKSQIDDLLDEGDF